MDVIHSVFSGATVLSRLCCQGVIVEKETYFDSKVPFKCKFLPHLNSDKLKYYLQCYKGKRAHIRIVSFIFYKCHL